MLFRSWSKINRRIITRITAHLLLTFLFAFRLIAGQVRLRALLINRWTYSC
jgi:hypothetical protein